ncbi:AraC family transcriptional regulator [Pseudomonas fluorescens]|uniref:AraC family transcriptional regulator n=1 Tax=Pseudomonas fluorescens TaxID=294 RepID=UPI00054C0E64|nr:AraC family transcriptional regulator [Pseudomonas fluorescens]KII33681.1 AraC family transcriptional regulator [Pseudomonas fluorescens]
MNTNSFASSAFALTILGHAVKFGLCEMELLQRAGISLSWLVDRPHIPAQLVDQLWRECEKAGAARNFGCEMAQGMATSCLQGLNILLDSAPTLRASLRCFIQHSSIVTNYVLVDLEEVESEARLYLRPSLNQPHFFGYDAAMVSLVSNLSRRVGLFPRDLFTGVTLAPEQAAAQWLQSQDMSTEQGSYPCLRMPRIALDLPLIGANPFLHQKMLQHWKSSTLSDARSDSLELARHWLIAGDQPIERIAERLGYRQSSNFIRAFRKQFGITPKQFRLASL